MTDALDLRAAPPELPAVITAERTWTFGELAALLADAPSGPTLVATPGLPTLVAIYAALAARRPLALIHDRLPAAEQARQRALVEAAALAPDTAVVLFTSGSTAAARGVELSRAALLANAAASAAHLGWHAADRWQLALSCAHSGGLSVVTRCLVARAPILLDPTAPPSGGASPERSLRLDPTAPPSGGASPERSLRLDPTAPPSGGASPERSLRLDPTAPPSGGASPERSLRLDPTAPPSGGASPERSLRLDPTTPPSGGASPERSLRLDPTAPPSGGASPERSLRLDPTAPPSGGASPAATLTSLVPTQLAALLDDPAWRPAPELRAVLLGGAAASPALLAAARARGVPVRTTYGLTETFGQVATALADDGAPVPLPGVTLLAGTPGAPARIRVRGPMLATRYLDGAPIAPELATADLGHLDATGALHIAGRADDVIISGGENVHPGAVEAVLAATPGVRAALAFGVADERWGQLVAVALAVDATFDLAAAAARWRAALPGHALPRRVALVAALPQGATGKLDRRAAAALPGVAVDYRAPQSTSTTP